MTATALIDHVKEATGAVEREEVTPQGQIALHVTPANWHVVAEHLRRCPRCNFGMFNWLSAVDMEDQGFEVIVHLYSASSLQAVNIKTMVPRDGGSVRTLTDLWRGASFHERECWEMFDIGFDGHPHLVKLLLAEPFVGHPLRKEFLLMTREAKEWPGAKEPE
ncbi:MAG TPA: NADH-quinone oxidoreductase subunit C [Actinomycetota bacterium]